MYLARMYAPAAVISQVQSDRVRRLESFFTAAAMCLAPPLPSSQSSMYSTSREGKCCRARASWETASSSKLLPKCKIDGVRNLVGSGVRGLCDRMQA